MEFPLQSRVFPLKKKGNKRPGTLDCTMHRSPSASHLPIGKPPPFNGAAANSLLNSFQPSFRVTADSVFSHSVIVDV